MDISKFKTLFERLLQENGIEDVTDEQIKKFFDFTNHFMAVNAVTNLSAIRDVPSIIVKHYIDSLLLSRYIPMTARVLDLGCGPGFPSLPLAILRSDVEFVSLDSTAKKIAFLQESAALIGLSNIRGVAGRAEDRALAKMLGDFDAVVSRAVANPLVLCELSLPYLKIGGQMLAMKGAMVEDEVKTLNNSKILSLVGGEKASFYEWKLFGGAEAETRGVIVVKKQRKGDPAYPRAYATILKKPL